MKEKINKKNSLVEQETELVYKLKKQDRKMQFKVYKDYYRAMYNTSLRILNNNAEAEDVMQESFLSAFKNINSFSGNVTFGSWLKKIVINRSLDRLKSNRLVFTEIADVIPDEKEDETLFDDNQAMIEEVRKQINSLPDGYRVVLSLYLIEGYDHEEIGSILGISASTSRSQFTRAKQKLIELIKKNKQQ